MTKKDSRKQQADSSTRGSSRRLYFVIAFAVLLASTSYPIYHFFFRSPTITTIDFIDPSNTEFMATIQPLIDAARQDPRSAQARARLGLAFEANKYWAAARQCYQNATLLDSQEPMWPNHVATTWLKMDDTQGAKAWIHQYTQRFPSFAPLLHRYGILLLDDGKIEEAKKRFEKVVVLLPDSPVGYLGLGDIALQNGEYQTALNMSSLAVQLNPDDKSARYLLGRAHRAMGNLEEAKRELTLGKGAIRRFLVDTWSTKLSEYDVSLSRKQVQAVEYLNEGKYAEAEELLTFVLASEPRNLEALVNLGSAYMHMGRLEESRDTFDYALQLDSTRFETHINMASCYRRLGDPTKALEHAEKAVALAPDMAQTNHARGLALMELDLNEEALLSLVKANTRDPSNARILQDLANTYVRLERYAEALDQYQSLIVLLPMRWEPQYGIAKVSLKLGRMEEAIAAVTAGLNLSPTQPQLHSLARKIMEMHGQ